MGVRAFPTFEEASAFAKNIARDHKATVQIVRRGAEFVVESKVTFDPKPPAPKPKSQPPTRPVSPPTAISGKPSEPSLSRLTSANERHCSECGDIIPPERVTAVPTVSRCIKCQSSFEKTHDTRRRIDEGLLGTREEHKEMRGQLWGDMRNRSRGR